MTREWSFLRLRWPLWMVSGEQTASVLSSVLPGLVGHLRDADPAGRWQFRRYIGDAPFLDLSFLSTASTYGEIERRLCAEVTKRQWPAVVERHGPPAPAYSDDRGAELASRLASASSDFAIDQVRDGELSPRRQLLTCVTHLRHIVELIASGDRRPFLFAYWRDTSDELDPAVRVALSAEARRRAHAVLEAASTIAADPVQHDRWRHYLHEVDEVSRERRADDRTPMNYLLFEHARHTHDRLGIPIAVQALAAQIAYAGTGTTPTAPPPPMVLLRVPVLKAT